jgi:hypothetical protein
MQDIDFDEIDRAVSSAARTIPPQRAEDIEVAPRPAVVPVTAPVAAPVTPAARRSSGRFMDVVHASSDMRPARSSAPSAPSLHREEVIDRTEVAPRPVATTVASTAFHWPDTVQASQPTAAPVPEAPAVAEPAAPLESPFLANAPIEKRPLGAFSVAESTIPLIEDPIPAPTELTSPVETQSLAADVASLLDETVVSEEAIVEVPVADTDTVEPVAEPAPALIEEQPTGPTSIIQQYQEQPSVADAQATGSIYDTEAYHQPIVQPPKKHSGWLVVVWLLSLILVGGGIGAGVYFIVLPMLG